MEFELYVKTEHGEQVSKCFVGNFVKMHVSIFGTSGTTNLLNGVGVLDMSGNEVESPSEQRYYSHSHYSAYGNY